MLDSDVRVPIVSRRKNEAVVNTMNHCGTLIAELEVNSTRPRFESEEGRAVQSNVSMTSVLCSPRFQSDLALSECVVCY